MFTQAFTQGVKQTIYTKCCLCYMFIVIYVPPAEAINSVWEMQQISYSDTCGSTASCFSLSKTAPSFSDSKPLEDQSSPKYSDATQEFYSLI